jgi:hypothetical protein
MNFFEGCELASPLSFGVIGGVSVSIDGSVERTGGTDDMEEGGQEEKDGVTSEHLFGAKSLGLEIN